MTVIVTDTDGVWRMVDVIWVDGGVRNPKTPKLFQVADVDSGVINWVNADFVTHHRSMRLKPLFVWDEANQVSECRQQLCQRKTI